MAEGDSVSRTIRRRAPAALLGLAAVAAYGLVTVFTLFNGQTFTAEVSALVRSWWYSGGAISPYTATDATRAMPLYFYELGFWQQIGGAGHITGRVLSILLGAVSGLLLFDICRRLTANTAAAAAATFLFLATPTTAFFLASATPAATVAALHLIAILTIVASVGRPRAPFSFAMGVLCAALYLTSRGMIAGIVVLAPLYILAVGRDRILQTVSLLAGMGVVMAGAVLLLPPQFGPFALNLPFVGGILGDAGLLGPNYTLVARGTHGFDGAGTALSVVGLQQLLETFVLPNLGTLVLALVLFLVARGPLRFLWIVPLYFLWLAFAYHMGLDGLGPLAVLGMTPVFAAIGALAAALALAMSAQWAKRNNLPPGGVLVAGAAIALALNAAAPILATTPMLKGFPRPLLDGLRNPPEIPQLPVLARWVSNQVPPRTPILVMHDLGPRDLPALAYAVALAGHPMPPQSLDLRSTRRTINESLEGAAREGVRAALEEEGLWSSDTLRRWIARDYNAILLQDGADRQTAAVKQLIESHFDRSGATMYRGRPLLLYTRRPL